MEARSRKEAGEKRLTKIMMGTEWERCPRCEQGPKPAWLFKVKIIDGKVWLYCWLKSCGWRIELPPDIALKLKQK